MPSKEKSTRSESYFQESGFDYRCSALPPAATPSGNYYLCEVAVSCPVEVSDFDEIAAIKAIPAPIATIVPTLKPAAVVLPPVMPAVEPVSAVVAAAPVVPGVSVIVVVVVTVSLGVDLAVVSEVVAGVFTVAEPVDVCANTGADAMLRLSRVAAMIDFFMGIPFLGYVTNVVS